MHVFTYGSLMFPEVWRIVVGREFETVEGAVAGYSIFRVDEAEYPGITAAGGDGVVRGLVYLDVDDASVARLDRFEGSLYDRVNLPIVCVDGVLRTAEAYVISESNRHALTAEMWTAEEFVSSGGLAEFMLKYQGFSWLGGEG